MTSHFEDACWARVTLNRVALTDIDFRAVDLTGIRADTAVLINANLSGQSLAGSSLRRCTLQGADLSDADLSGAD